MAAGRGLDRRLLDPQPFHGPGDVPERCDASDLLFDQEAVAGLDPVELQHREDAETGEHEQRNGQKKDEAPGDRHG